VEEAQRRTDELIQKMLLEDQEAEREEGEFDDDNLPDENTQIEYLRRLRHDQVASEAENHLKLLEELKR